ncbi:glycerophosphodiester phosphodiesterase family protein [Methylobacterium sp. Gmos1]
MTVRFIPRALRLSGVALLLAALPPVAPSLAADLPTLDGKPPAVIAHRGLSGLAPEETEPAYELAADLGADMLEMDLHLTKDCVPVARHNPWLSDNTTVAQVARTNPEVARRRRTVPGRVVAGPGPSYLTDLTDPADPSSVLRSLVVDGEDHTGDWAISDFTLAELKDWLAGTTYDAADERPRLLNGKFAILSFQEIVDLARRKGARAGRPIAVYPETKNPTWNNAQARANGCPGERPFEDAVLRVIEANGLNAADAPILVQSFEPGSLRYLAAHGLKTRRVQLVGASGIDYRTGAMLYEGVTEGRPFDWVLAGDPRRFDAMLTPEGLAEIRTYADGIGPWKPQVLPLRTDPWPGRNPDGTPFKGTTAKARTGPATRLVADAHRAGLFVHVYTFRNEPRYLAADYDGDPVAEYLAFFRLGVDGVFSDFAHTAAAARADFLRGAAAK